MTDGSTDGTSEGSTERLRYADGPTTAVSRVIAAGVDDVWALVSDVQLPARFSTEYQGAEWLDDAVAPAVGARFRGTNRHPVVGEWQAVCTIVEYEPQRVIGWQVAGPDGPAAHWRFTLETVEGGTKLTQWCRIGPGRSGLSPAIEKMPEREHDIVSRRLSEHAANMQRNLDGIADLVER